MYFVGESTAKVGQCVCWVKYSYGRVAYFVGKNTAKIEQCVFWG